MRTEKYLKHCMVPALMAATLLVAANTAAAADWPHWRGPNFNGVNDDMALPTEWSATKNVAWAAAMPGPSSATPVVWKDRVFAVSASPDADKLYGLCLDRDSGKILWQKQLVSGGTANSRNDMASCSPVTDGKLVVFLFGSSDLFAFDFNGKELWSRNLNREFAGVETQWGYASSPLLYKGKLYISVLRGTPISKERGAPRTGDNSYLYCMEPASGKLIWKQFRESDSIFEAHDSYASPIPYVSGKTEAIVVAGAGYITGNDAATGAELWRHAHDPDKIKNWRLIPSPVVADGLICGVQPRGGPAFAFLPGKKARLAYEEAEWIYDERTTDAPTPAYYQGRLYVLNGARQIMICVDPKTGEEIWRGDLGGDRLWASPSAGDGKIYCFSESGETIILAAGDEFKVLARASLPSGGEQCKSSIAIAHGKLFIRTTDTLYCISQ